MKQSKTIALVLLLTLSPMTWPTYANPSTPSAQISASDYKVSISDLLTVRLQLIAYQTALTAAKQETINLQQQLDQHLADSKTQSESDKQEVERLQTLLKDSSSIITELESNLDSKTQEYLTLLDKAKEDHEKEVANWHLEEGLLLVGIGILSIPATYGIIRLIGK